MLAAALIVFREVFEAGLILGIVLGATRRVPGWSRQVAGGMARVSRALHALADDSDWPVGIQVLAYGAVLGMVLIAGRLLEAGPVEAFD